MAKIKVSKENKTGRNTHFEITREEFVRQIDNKQHPNYHIRTINGVRTPASNPNKNKKDNLG